MTRILHAIWHVSPLSLPLVERHCSTCKVPRPFRCSGKIRLNANGRRLGAWLIYKCTVCDRTWNLPLMDRVPVGEVPPADLAAMQTSDPAWVWPRAFDVAALRRHVSQVSLPTDLVVTKRLAEAGPGDWSAITLRIEPSWPTGQRLDRLLGQELGLSRSFLQALQGSGALSVVQGPRHALRLPLAGSIVLQFDLGRITASACGALTRAFGVPPSDAGF